MSLFPNQFTPNYNSYFYNTPNPFLHYLAHPNQYFYVTYPPLLLQHYPTVFLPPNHYQNTFLPLAPLQQQITEKVQVFQKELAPQQNQENEDINLKKEYNPSCVKARKREQVIQLSQQMVSKCGNDRFIKKNTESNIINQIFSFLWSPEKSLSLLRKILENQTKVTLFYGFMRVLKTNCKSMLNRSFLKQLTSPQGWQLVLKKLKKKLREGGNLQKEQLSNIVRRLTLVYLREVSRYSIMTSKKMNQRLWDLHFKKCHEVKEFLFSC